MNKLLQRLPDSSREEVRNQAIVLIQQLTSTNEEMKKTVVFNEVRVDLGETMKLHVILVFACALRCTLLVLTLSHLCLFKYSTGV